MPILSSVTMAAGYRRVLFYLAAKTVSFDPI